MKRVVLALPVLVVLAAVALPGAQGRSAETGVCDLMKPSKMLENPGLAHVYAQALRSGEAREIARIEGLLRDIRAAHGCEGEVALPSPPRKGPALPPGHPPVGAPHAPSSIPFIEAPGTVTI